MPVYLLPGKYKWEKGQNPFLGALAKTTTRVFELDPDVYSPSVHLKAYKLKRKRRDRLAFTYNDQLRQ